jgi:hypothetical protein
MSAQPSYRRLAGCTCSIWKPLLALLLYAAVCVAAQSIEHLKWDRSKVAKTFSYEGLTPAAANWLGQQQLEDVNSKVEVR